MPSEPGANPSVHLIEFRTRHGMVSVWSDCRVEVFDEDRSYAGLDPPILLPGDLDNKQWKQLTDREQLISLNADRKRLFVEIEALKRQVDARGVAVLVSGVTIFSLFVMLFFY